MARYGTVTMHDFTRASGYVSGLGSQRFANHKDALDAAFKAGHRAVTILNDFEVNSMVWEYDADAYGNWTERNGNNSHVRQDITKQKLPNRDAATVYASVFYDFELVVSNTLKDGNRITSERSATAEIPLHVSLKGHDGNPDAQTGHFGYNFYFRTRKGLNGERYANEKALRRAILNALQRKTKLIPLRWQQVEGR